jgi:hypothetical protein
VQRFTPQQERAVRAVREALPAELGATEVVSHELYGHWEDEELGLPPRAVILHFSFRAGPFRVHASTAADGEIEAVFAPYASEREPGGPWHAQLGPGDRERLLAHGWRQRGPWTALWPAGPEHVVAGLLAVRGLSPRLLRPEDLPPGRKWPWIDLIEHGLFADAVLERVRERDRWLVTTSVGGETHRLQLYDEDDALLTWWHAAPRVLRPWSAS